MIAGTGGRAHLLGRPLATSPRQGRSGIFRRFVGATLAALLTVGGVIIATATSAAAVTAPSPQAVRNIGFPGHAEIYGWGAATMLDGSVLIGDYWNLRVRHFATDGSLIGDFV